MSRNDGVLWASLLVGAIGALSHRARSPNASFGECLLHGVAWAAGTAAVVTGAKAVGGAVERWQNPPTLISHHHSNDGWYREHLAELGESGELGKRFRDIGPTRRIRTRDPSRIRADLTRRVRDSDQVVVVVGEQTHRRRYVRHEIDVAVEEGKRLVAVKLNPRFKAPPELLGVGARWVMSPDPLRVAEALK